MAKGKYAHVIDKLPRILGTEPKYQEKVEAVKKEMLRKPCSCGHESPVPELHEGNCDIHDFLNFIPGVDLAKQYIDIRNEIDDLETRLYDANLRLEATSQHLTGQMEVEGSDSLSLIGRGVVRTQWEPYAKVEDKERFRLWCVNVCQTCGLHKDKHTFADADYAGIIATVGPHDPATLEGSLQLWPSTMTSITKERLLAGLPEPEGVTAHAKVKLVLTREK